MIFEINSIFSKNDSLKSYLFEKIYYLEENIINAKVSKNKLYLTFKKKIRNQDSLKLKKNLILLQKQILNSHERIKIKILSENEGKSNYNKNPMSILIKSKELKKVFSGVYSLSGNFLDVFNKLDHKFLKYAKSLKAVEHFYNPILPLSSLVENGYIQNFTHQPIVCSHFKRNIKKLSQINFDKNINTEIGKYTDNPNYVLSPNVCFHCFDFLKNSKLNKNFEIFTAKTTCSRYESLNVEDLIRLQSFTMREIIYYGSNDNVENIRNKTIKHFKMFLDKLDLKSRFVSASDPFFADINYAKTIFQTTMNTKIEAQVWIPYKKKWLAVASFNNHMDVLVNKYNIKLKNNNKLFSGCTGYGYERLLFSIISQHGPQLKKIKF